MAGYHLHGGPYSGERSDTQQLSRQTRDAGVWSIDGRIDGRRWVGRYVCDQQSAGGRDWDWEEG